MPKADFFARHGLFVAERFLAEDRCASICAELRSASLAASKVERCGAFVVDEQVRRTSLAAVSAETASEVGDRLEGIRQDLERHFQVRLTACEPPTFAVYRPGDFFLPHRDAGTAEALSARKVSAVLFLNGEADAPAAGTYGGGSLTFYGLVEDPPWDAMGFPVVGQAGLLVAFPAGMVHEVTAVTHGERCVALSRYS
jgi:predicted 2-oxoglutarate/Fe(II)-dependent dioxygenase YbiX